MSKKDFTRKAFIKQNSLLGLGLAFGKDLVFPSSENAQINPADQNKTATSFLHWCLGWPDQENCDEFFSLNFRAMRFQTFYSDYSAAPFEQVDVPPDAVHFTKFFPETNDPEAIPLTQFDTCPVFHKNTCLQSPVSVVLTGRYQR